MCVGAMHDDAMCVDLIIGNAKYFTVLFNLSPSSHMQTNPLPLIYPKVPSMPPTPILEAVRGVVSAKSQDFQSHTSTLNAYRRFPSCPRMAQKESISACRGALDGDGKLFPWIERSVAEIVYGEGAFSSLFAHCGDVNA